MSAFASGSRYLYGGGCSGLFWRWWSAVGIGLPKLLQAQRDILSNALQIGSFWKLKRIGLAAIQHEQLEQGFGMRGGADLMLGQDAPGNQHFGPRVWLKDEIRVCQNDDAL